MNHVIVRNGLFLSWDLENMWTKYLQDARIFPSKEAAEKECCENETVLALSEFLTIG